MSVGEGSQQYRRNGGRARKSGGSGFRQGRLAEGFAVFAATVLALVVFSPVVETQASIARSDADVVLPEAMGAEDSESAPLPNESTDSPGGPSPPPGSVSSVYIPPTPIQSTLPSQAIGPHLVESGVSYRYNTVVGSYEFSKGAAYLVKYWTLEGSLLVSASTFAVLAPNVTLFLAATVLNATDYQFRVRYDVVRVPDLLANVTITYDFLDAGPPKVTAEFNKTRGPTPGLAWVVFTADHVVFNGETTTDFGSLKSPISIPTSQFRLEVGPNTDPSNWGRRATIDWADAGDGMAFAGPLSITGVSGPAIFVKFPADLARVDPTVAGTSSSLVATEYSIQRKTFEYGNRFWVFWYDGANIAYASSQISYANSQNTVSWTAKMSTGSGALPSGIDYTGFDVDQRDGTVLVAYSASDLLSVKLLKGSITGSFITWSGPYVVDSWFNQPKQGLPSVAIGSDGYYWVGGIRISPDSGFPPKVYVYRSTDAGSTSFSVSTSTQLSGVPRDTAVRLVTLANGGLVYITSTLGSSTIITRRYRAGGWESSYPWDIRLPTADQRGRILSAIADSDGVSVHIVSKGDNTTAPGIQHAMLGPTDSLTSQPTIDSTPGPDQPTVAKDVSGELHVFWRYVSSAPTQYRIRYANRYRAFGAWATTEPWGSSSVVRTGLTAGILVSSQAILAWTDGSGSPYSISFGAVAAPMDLGSQTGAPWNRRGISPYQSYFHHLSELVSPGSGLLTIKQTDLHLPGRGLDLEISRVFLTPRAFFISASSPYLYEDYPWAKIGKGWHFNFPWLSVFGVHLWDGQLYKYEFNGDTFENHDGEHFTLKRTSYAPGCTACFTLSSKDGRRYEFDEYGKLTAMRDANVNSIIFAYTGSGFNSVLANVTDTVGRKVVFAYNANGTLASLRSSTQTVRYSYLEPGGNLVLDSVKDPLSHETKFEYADARSRYLMTGIKYATGAKSTITWSTPAVTTGPDLQGYYVTRQDTLNSVGQSIRANVFDYSVVNGRVSYAKVSAWDAGAEKGCTVQSFDQTSRRTTTMLRAAPCAQSNSGAVLGKQVSWFDPTGAVGQVDEYPGSAAAPSHSLAMGYDDWGNQIYSRDGVGHERFGSYVNTRHQGGFYAPGRLTRTTSGLLLFDDFEDRDLSDWVLDQSAGTVGLDYSVFESAPPSVKIAHTGQPSGVASATHTFSDQTASFVAEVIVRAEETNREHFVLLRSATSTRVYMNLYSNGSISWHDGSAWRTAPGMTYQPMQWYRLGFEVYPASNLYDIWVNGRLAKAGAPLLGSGAINKVTLQASWSAGPSATMYADIVKVYVSRVLTVQGLQPGQVVRFMDALNREAASARVASGSTTATMVVPTGIFPYGTLRIFDGDGNVGTESPFHEFWGGDTWTYAAPWRSASLTRTRTGLLRALSTGVYVNESVPTGAVGAQDGWDYGSYDFPAAGSLAHKSKYLTGFHEHYFKDSSTLAVGANDFLIQYVFIPDNQQPSELMLQFRDTQDSWEHRAFWGANILNGTGWGQYGTTSRRPMGLLPVPFGRWNMLAVSATDLNMNGKTLEGVNYTLVGGRATWDFTAVGDAETGKIQVAGLFGFWVAELYDVKGNLLGSATVPSGGSVAGIDVCNTVVRRCAFPFEGYFIVKDGSPSHAPVYRSPVFSLWGGDVYTYSQSTNDFYTNVQVDVSMHDRLAGGLEYRTGRGATPVVPEAVRVSYTPKGLPDRMNVYDGTAWRETRYGYDGTYGLLTTIQEPGQNTWQSLFYSEANGRAYVTSISDNYGSRQLAYDSGTGWIIAEKGGRGFVTRYEMDLVGRTTAERHFDLEPGSESLYFDMDFTTESSPPLMWDLSGQYNHGSISGTTAGAGRAGMAREFDGSGDYLQAPDSSSLDVSGNQIALAAWIYPKSTGSNTIINKEASYQIAVNNGLLQAAVETTAAGSWAWGGNQTVPLNRWTHVAFVYEGGTTWKFYVNGNLRESIAPAGGQTGSIVPSNYALRIGDRTSGSGPFVGLIDEARVFNAALNATDVSALSSNAYRLLSSSEIAFDDVGNSVTVYDPTTRPRALHLDMETLLNSKLEDLSGHGLHGALTGTTPTGGKFGGARDFTGTSDMVTVSASPALNASDTFTVAMWINPDTLPASGGRGIVGKLDFTNSWRIWIRPDGKIEFDSKLDAVGNLVSATSVTIVGGWYQVAGTFDGKTARLYVNGVSEASGNTSDWGNAANVNIGIGDTDSTSPFDGQIDEVQLFGRALSGTEVTELYQGAENGFYQKEYFDVLGRSTRGVRRDLFGTLVTWRTDAYDFHDRITSHTVSRSNTSSFTTSSAYDFLGRPTSITYPDFPANPATFTYDDVNRIRTIIAENGRKTQYLYDVGGRTTFVREFNSPSTYFTTSYAYDDTGNLLSVTNAMGQVTQHEYDYVNRLVKTTYPDPAKFETYVYDATGNLRTKTDRAGQVTTYGYDSRHRPTSVDYPGTSFDVSTVYDADNNPTSVTNPGALVTYAYDGLGRVFVETTTIASVPYPVGYVYDKADRVVQLTFPDHTQQTPSYVAYVYDPLGRTRQVRDQTGTTLGTLSYFADDLTKTVALGNGVNEAFLYNGRGWSTSIRATNGATTYLDLSYSSYDASGNIFSIGGTTQSTQAFTYDQLDRLTTASGGYGYQNYAYDSIGNRLSMSNVVLRPNAAGSSAQWTPVGSCSANWQCVDEATSDGSASYVSTGTNGYQDLYALSDLSGTGSIESVTVGALASGDIDDSGCQNPPPCNIIRSRARLLVKTGGTVYAGAATIVDGGTPDSPVSISSTWTTNPGTGLAWTVAEVNALEAGVSKYSGVSTEATQLYVTVRFQGAATYTYASGAAGMNTLTSVAKASGTTSFTYDANGNLDTKTGGWDYDWNAEGLMTVAKLNGVQQQAYTYDGIGRRVKVDGAAGSGGWTVSIVSGMDVIYEKDNAGAVTKYVYANGMRIAKINPDGTVHYFLADHQGSTRKILDASRVEQYSAQYEPFGKPYATSGSKPDPHKYTAEKLDDPTGLVHLRARQYDPEIGRFVSADPVLGSRGQPQTLNRYSYVANNPLTSTDPSGMYPCNPQAGDQLYAACQRWQAWDEWTATAQPIGDFWLGMDILMSFVGFFPGLDTISDVYFTGRDIAACQAGACDPLALGLDAFSLALPIGLAGITRLPKFLNRMDNLARAANRFDQLIPPGGVFETTAKKLAMNGVPNSMVRQLDVAGNLKSLGSYNDFGQLYRRIDVGGSPHFIPGRGETLPHVSEFKWGPGGLHEGWGFKKLDPRPTTYWEDFLIRVYG